MSNSAHQNGAASEGAIHAGRSSREATWKEKLLHMGGFVYVSEIGAKCQSSCKRSLLPRISRLPSTSPTKASNLLSAFQVPPPALSERQRSQAPPTANCPRSSLHLQTALPRQPRAHSLPLQATDCASSRTTCRVYCFYSQF